MRLASLAAVATLAGAVLVAAEPAAALDLNRGPVAPEGYHAPRTVHHWIYKPRYHHVYHVSGSADPYAYRYSPRGYYPYYASRYWVPAEQMKNRSHQAYEGPKYKYHPSWGVRKHGYDHKQYHGSHHGFHHKWHW